MPGNPKVLVAASDPESCRALIRILPRCGVEPVLTSTVREARVLLSGEPVAMVICETRLADGSFHDLLREASGAPGKVPVVVASRLDDTKQYLEAMKQGAFDFIVAPYRHSEVGWIVRNALRRAVRVA